jgi:hypothetical protein
MLMNSISEQERYCSFEVFILKGLIDILIGLIKDTSDYEEVSNYIRKPNLII